MEMGGIYVIFEILKSRFKFVGVIIVSLFIDWGMGLLPGVPCTAYKPNKLFYFESGIYVVIFLN